MGQLLIDNQLLLLFMVTAIGYLVGKISFKGNSLGVASVLFVGLGFGAFNPDFQVHEIIFQLGLVLFVYSIGLSSGPAFFKSFNKNGIRDISFVFLMLTFSAMLALAIHFLFDFHAGTTTGLYSGSTTNTPALAGVIDFVNNQQLPSGPDDIQKLVVAYTYSYPMGVLGVILSIVVMEKLLRIDYKAEMKRVAYQYGIDSNLTSKSIDITNPEVAGMQLRDIRNKYRWNVVFGRVKSEDGELSLSNWDTKLNIGDKIMVVGSKSNLAKVIAEFGNESEEKLSLDRRKFDVRRIFVSNPYIVGKQISALNLDRKYNTIITRIRRGDVDMLAKPDFVLEQGDRIRFVARRKDLKKLAKFFGDSYFESSKVNIFSYGLGIALGLILGMQEFALPMGINLKLGYAGGPLIVALVLGAIRRTGPVVWTLPYGSNITLQQIGLTLLLAVIGLRSGATFVESLSSGGGLIIFIGGVILSTLGACLSLFVGYKLFKLPFSLLLGFVSNQPAILDFANNRSKSSIPYVGYTLMFPIALVMKIVFAQLIFVLLS